MIRTGGEYYFKISNCIEREIIYIVCYSRVMLNLTQKINQIKLLELACTVCVQSF